LGWFLEDVLVRGVKRGGGPVEERCGVGAHTFSSSLRFSLRFLRRRAISARRMACSSAVKCFFVCGSAGEKVGRA